MSSKIIHIGWNAPMSQAFELMQKNRLRHLPVMDDEMNLIGIVSDRDVQRAMKSELRWEETLQAKIPVFETVEFDPSAKVRHYMSWPVKSVHRNADLRRVAGLMVADKISAVLVMDGDRFVGIVTTEDLLKVLMGLLGDASKGRALPMELLFERPEASA
ncbi:MAG: CBS domain-containing protein [Deltaproteobacteria bacterium]|nr:CBS domain-containing protein [Deltaproteobacteria bacterium]